MTQSAKHRWVALGAVWGIVVLANILRLPGFFTPHVRVEAVELAPLKLMVRAPGNLEARKSVTLKAKFEGNVIAKTFREGQVVHAGERLLEINRDKIRLDYEAKHDALNNARADLERAKKDLRIQKKLFKEQAVAYSAVEDSQRALVRATQVLRNSEEAFKLESDRWNSNVLVAPFAGTIVRDSIGDALAVNAGQDLLGLADVSEFTVRARVDEIDIKLVREGQPAEVRVQIYPKEVFQAKVIQVGTAPEEAGIPSMPVTLRLLPSKESLLRPRLTADVRILTGETAPVLSVPLKAIDNTQGFTHVWGVNALNRLTTIPVTLDRSNPDRVEVLSGVKPGQWVCQESLPVYREGLRVIVDRQP